MIYLYLFVSFLQVGMFSFGGGYAAMPLIQEQVVTIHLAGYIRIYRSGHNLSDDSGSNLNKCSNFCWN